MSDLFLTDAQLRAAIQRCEYCEEKPCREACPAHCSPADFIMAARGLTEVDIRRAAARIMTLNPLGGVCGGVCPDWHCQAACVHKDFDGPVEIPAIQAAIIARAKAMGVMPVLDEAPPNGRRVAVVGAGPAGLAAALTLAQYGYEVVVLEKESVAGGAVALVPEHRLEGAVLASDIDWVLEHSRVSLEVDHPVDAPAELLAQGYDAVLVSVGRHVSYTLGIPGEDSAVPGNVYLRDPRSATGRVAVIGGGAIACDCAVTALESGAEAVEMFVLEKAGEMPLTAKEMALLLDHGVEINGRTRVTAIDDGAGTVSTVKVRLPRGEAFHPTAMTDVGGTEQVHPGFERVVLAIGNRPGLDKGSDSRVVWAGDCDLGATTVVEASAAGKNAAALLHARLSSAPEPVVDNPRKSRVVVPGYDALPVPLDVDFFGRRISSPLLLSAAPPTDGYEQMKLAFEAGWAGGIMKTAFRDGPIHIPADYMHVFDRETYGNCDNVSGHLLDRVCREVEELVRDFPHHLVAASTGGPVTGDDALDKAAWQRNTRLLEDAGVMAIEYSLSCPQGGDGTEGDIVSQSPSVTAKIVDWIMESGQAEVPKLFKLTGAVTSVAVIVSAIKEVLDRYPGKKAGVTLANTFPTLMFRPGDKEGWDEGIVVGMSGAGVAPISNLTLANVAHLGVTVSGNGGPMDYRAAAHFLALGARTVQFCTVAMKYGLHVIDELHDGLSHLMAARGIASVEELIGRALPGGPIRDFMDLTPVKGISQPIHELCMRCGNCTRCSYLAISLGDDGLPVVDPARCIGCSLCTQKCFAGALEMRARTPEELAALVEH